MAYLAAAEATLEAVLDKDEPPQHVEAALKLASQKLQVSTAIACMLGARRGLHDRIFALLAETF